MKLQSSEDAEARPALSLTRKECPHSRAHITDARCYASSYSSHDSHRIFCDDCTHQRWLDVEAALALAQARTGLIPHEAARRIASCARMELLDADVVRAQTLRTGHSLMGLLNAFTRVCGADAGAYVHFGATTQDIQDTAQALQMAEVLDLLDARLESLCSITASLARRGRATLGLGRTHAQPALPIVFGLKAANWADELMRHRERLAQARSRIAVAQLFGGAGTMAGFGENALALVDAFAGQLGLSSPNIAWHTARDRVVEFTCLLAMAAGSLVRIADEIRTLSRPEVGEVSEGWVSGTVGSSTMPHKRNPERAEQIVVLGRLAAAQVPIAFSAMSGEHERDGRTLRLEWACVPDCAHYTLGACDLAVTVLSGLQINDERLADNLRQVSDQVMSERVMFALSRRIGKHRAHLRVYELIQQAIDAHRPVREVLDKALVGTGQLTATELDNALDPASYLGSCSALIDRVIAQVSMGAHGSGHQPQTKRRAG